jgi:hypothetical protein
MVYTDGVHLVADTLKELHSFARSLGFKREWFQDHHSHPHYDLTTKRVLLRATKAGALLVRSKKIVAISRNIKNFPGL